MESFFVFVLQRSALAALVVLFILLLRWMLSGRLSPRTRHALWFFLLPVLLLPAPIIPVRVASSGMIAETSRVSLPPAGTKSLHREPGTPSPAQGGSFSNVIESTSVSMKNTGNPAVFHAEPVSKIRLPSVFSLLTAAWLLGIIAFPALSLMQVLRLRHRFRNAGEIMDENILSMLERCKKAMGIRSPVRLVESGRILCPALTGILKPRIILPSGFAGQCGEERLSHLLCHELAHLKRRDILTGWLASLLCFIHWFNPLVWIAVRKMNDDAEEAADQIAMRPLDRQRRVEYGRTLLSLAERYYSDPDHRPMISRHVPGFVGVMESSTQLSRRIEMIERHDTWRRRWTFLAVLLCLAVSVAVLVRVQFVEAQTAAEPEKPMLKNEKIEIKPAEVKQGEFKTFAPVQDKKKTKVFGRVLKPDGEVADGIVFQFRGYPDGWTISSGGGVPRSGAFDVEVPANSSYIAAVFDKKNRYAAPPLNIKIGDEAPEGELVFQLEDGVPVTASFLDETTGKPISGLEIYLAQRVETEDDDLWVDLEKKSDENGLFETHALPGEYIISIDSQYFKDDVVRKGVYARKFTVEKDKPVKIEFRIPTPFSGTVFDAAGAPAKEQIVFVIPTDLGRSEDSQQSTFTRTNKDGVFRCLRPPVNTTVNVLERGSGQYFAWLGDELAGRSEAEFRLVESVEVKGRLLDAKTSEPMADQLFFYWKKNPKKPTQQAFSPEMGKTNKQGVFGIKLNPTLVYDLFVVHGRQSRHGGGPYYPRIDLVTLTPESFESKTVIDLGDLIVDPAKAVGDVASMRDEEHAQKMRTLYRSVKRGEKKAFLQVTIKEGGEPTREYIEKRQNEKPFDSFAIMLVDYTSIPKEHRDRWENSDDEVIRNSTSEKVVIGMESPKGKPALIVLSELRGEKDSPWNVPKDDPPTGGDWKQTPGMVNPKIFENFLNDYLKKLDDPAVP